MPLSVGDKAPDFEAKDEVGNTVRLSDFNGKSNVVLYFYPKAETPGCTAEAKCFRDNWDAIKGQNAVVLGVSSDAVDKQKSFKNHYSLQFSLLSDVDKSIREKYGAKGFLIPPRMTFVIDTMGVVRGIHNSQLDPRGHVDFALEILRKSENWPQNDGDTA